MHYVLVVDVSRTCLGVFVMIICGMCCQLTRAVDSDDNVVYGCDSGGCLLRHSTANTTQHTDTTANPAVTVRPISSDDSLCDGVAECKRKKGYMGTLIVERD